MFEKELRSALRHFDYTRAMRILNKINAAELGSYEISDSEDRMYWELDAKIEIAENAMHDKPKINGPGIWVEVW